MKKVVFIVLSVLSISISSCRKDEDILKQDPIIGKWRLFKKFANDKPLQFVECDGYSTFSYNADGTFIAENYDKESSDSDNCVKKTVFNAKWKNVGGGRYAHIKFGIEKVEKITIENNTFTKTQTKVYSNNDYQEKIVTKYIYKKD